MEKVHGTGVRGDIGTPDIGRDVRYTPIPHANERNDARLSVMRKWGVKLAEFDSVGDVKHVEFFEDFTPPAHAQTTTDIVTEAPEGTEVEAEPVDSDALYASS